MTEQERLLTKRIFRLEKTQEKIQAQFSALSQIVNNTMTAVEDLVKAVGKVEEILENTMTRLNELNDWRNRERGE